MAWGPSRSERRIAVMLVCATIAIGLFATSGRSADVVNAAEPARPNIVLILTDDQRWDTMWAMPQTRALLGERGMTFDESFVVNPLCCPSRTSLLTGRYSHGTGVYRNEPPHGGFASFDDRVTLATALDGVGYQTALIGKYLNGYSTTYIPPGWDRWVAFQRNNYFDYTLNVDGVSTPYGSAPADYSTDVIAGYADRFIRQADPAAPLFLDLSTSAPHAEAVPAPRHQTAFSDLAPWRPPSYNETDVSDKPAYISTLPQLDAYKINRIDTLRRDMYRTLLSVDDTVATVVQALHDTGRLEDTILVFTSDNGFLWGEHRWPARWGKTVPYEESIRVPLLIRYDAMIPAGSTFDGIVGNIDLSATFAELAGATLPGSDGISLVGSFADPTRWPRTDLLIEQLHGWPPNPSYCAIRTKDLMYAQYATHEEELYPVASDPYQLVNVASQPAWQDVVATMRHRVQQLCSPSPPGMTLMPGPVVTEHERGVRLELKKHLRANGRLTGAGGLSACTDGVDVVILKRRNGTWKALATAITSDTGRFRTELADKPGKYRAVVEPADVGDPVTDVCLGATSRPERHRHPRRPRGVSRLAWFRPV